MEVSIRVTMAAIVILIVVIVIIALIVQFGAGSSGQLQGLQNWINSIIGSSPK
jgi:nitrogen fixation-related uncharacterized protein